MTPQGPVLLYDGTCGVCAASVQFVLSRERRGTLRFASLQGGFGRVVRGRHPEIGAIDSVVWVEPGSDASPERVFVESDAVLRVLRYLGGPWGLLTAGRLIPRAVRDWLYRLVARHRYRLARMQCLLPSPDVRSRFLDP
ncbi:MAG: thiol-disulfide oxidoreductase DCC family protein [Vicinamibacterales bacterium]